MNNKFKVYEGIWERVSLVQTSKDGSFNVCRTGKYENWRNRLSHKRESRSQAERNGEQP